MRDYIRLLIANGFSADRASQICFDFMKNFDFSLAELDEYVNDLIADKGGASCG